MKKRKNRILLSLFAPLAVVAFAMYTKIDVSAATFPQEVLDQVDKEALKGVYDTIFHPDLVKEDVEVVTQEQSKSIPVAMTRLGNGKVAYTVYGEAFYPLGIETGWWDTRVDDNGKMSSNQADVGDNFKQVSDAEWNAYFADMKSMGFNTVQLMVYWEDWEPQEGVYDFTFLDRVTGLAADHGLKTEFVIFFHSQTDNIPRIKDKFWGYNLDNVVVDGEKYALSMQWGTNLTSAEDIRAYRDTYGNSAAGKENFLEYWHPEVFQRMNSALTELAAHYRDSANIVGYQIGNEEGFNYYVDNGDDKNPYYSALYDYWTADPDNTGKTKNQFRAETINNLWKCFHNSIHKGDPYKPTTSNTQSGNAEKQNKKDDTYANDGITMDFYKSVDMIGSMFYGEADKIYPNLDETYQNINKTAYATGFPILFPTEISANMNDGNVAKMITAQTIARGGQGIGIYCYGELYNDFEKNLWSSPRASVANMKAMMTTLKEIYDLIWSGIPVTEATTGNMFLDIKEVTGIAAPNQGKPMLDVLEAIDARVLGVLHFANNSNNSGSSAKEQRTVMVDLQAKEAGLYKVELHKTDGSIVVQNVTVDVKGGTASFPVQTTGCDVTYIVAEKASSEIPTEKHVVSVEISSLPDKVSYALGEAFHADGMKFRVCYTDGSAEVVELNDEFVVSEPDMDTEGQKEVAVTYKEHKVTFTISVLEAKYSTNLKHAPGSGFLDEIFDGSTAKGSSGGFIANEEDLEKMKNGEYYIQYNFEKDIELSGVELTTNYAMDQAILSFSLEVLDDNGNWVAIGEQKAGQKFDVNWQTNDQTMETQRVSFDPVVTSKVRMYVLDVANRWGDNQSGTNKKFEMFEIAYLTKALPEVISIRVDADLSVKTEYLLGEALDTTGLTITAVYDDQSEKDITGEVMISGFDPQTEGGQEIKFSYQHKWEASFPVTVCRPTKLNIITPSQMTYTVGEALNLTGMQVSAVLPSGATRSIAEADLQITGADFTTPGEKEITVSYLGVSGTFTVTVVDLDHNQDGNNQDNDQAGTDQSNGNLNGSNQGNSTGNHDKGSQINKPANTNKTNEVQTGDRANVFAFVGMTVFAGAIVGAGLWRKWK